MKEVPINSFLFNEEKGSVIAQISKDALSLENISEFISENAFFEKDEFHITLIGYGEGKNILSQNKFSEVKTLIESVDINNADVRISDDYILLEKDYEKECRFSIICIATSSFLDNLRNDIDNLLGVETKPFWHITLATRNAEGDKCDGIGIDSEQKLVELKPRVINSGEIISSIGKFIVPTRMQPDTITSIFLLKEFGKRIGYSINENFEIEINPAPKSSFWADLKEGTLQLDCPNSLFDHHNYSEQITLTKIISKFVDEESNQSLGKLFAYVERDDFHGKGTISNDLIDKAFGLSGLITALNKNYSHDPVFIYNSVEPLLRAHYLEEQKRNEQMPELVSSLKNENKIEEFSVNQRKKSLKAAIIESSDPSLPGYLRSAAGGNMDIVVQLRESGHVNIITKSYKNIDLRSLAAIVRKSELLVGGKETNFSENYLASEGRIQEVPEWYFDNATKSLQNGGINEGDVVPTQIPKDSFKNILIAGISEEYWSPIRKNK